MGSCVYIKVFGKLKMAQNAVLLNTGYTPFKFITGPKYLERKWNLADTWEAGFTKIWMQDVGFFGQPHSQVLSPTPLSLSLSLSLSLTPCGQVGENPGNWVVFSPVCQEFGKSSCIKYTFLQQMRINKVSILGVSYESMLQSGLVTIF